MSPLPPPVHGWLHLSHLGVIQAQGEEAAKFLHNQLTQDFLLIKPDEARLAAFCSPKGRMLASFTGFKRSANEVLLVCERDILAATLKRLSMFVMRAKLQLRDASDDFELLGLAGGTVQAVAGQPLAAHQKCDLGDVSLIGLPPAGPAARALWLAPAGTPVPGNADKQLTASQWRWLEVQSGVAPISTPIVDAFVPQMLNYESVDGVNFKKGCYPGQEVVARSQFRGTLKRRAYIVHGEGPLQAGQEVFVAGDTEQATGVIALAAANPVAGWDAIASFQTANAQASLHVGAADGPVLTVQPLPYALREDV